MSGNDEAIPSYLRDDINEPLPDLVDDKPLEVSSLRHCMASTELLTTDVFSVLQADKQAAKAV